MTERYDGIPGTYAFDQRMARAGYELNKMAFALAHKENREAFARDEDAFVARYALTPEQRQAVKERNWLRLIELGGNIYYIYKLTAAVKPIPMSELVARQRGLDQEALMREIAQRDQTWRG